MSKSPVGMLSCLEATRLIEQSSQEELPLALRLKLQFHLGLCKACKSYLGQSELIDKAILEAQEAKNSTQHEVSEDDAALKKRILDKLQQKDD